MNSLPIPRMLMVWRSVEHLKGTDSGCPQISVSCTGYGNVIIITNTPADSQGLVNYSLEDISVLSTVTATMSCLQYGWGAATPDAQILDNSFTCQGEGRGVVWVELGGFSGSRGGQSACLSQ